VCGQVGQLRLQCLCKLGLRVSLSRPVRVPILAEGVDEREERLVAGPDSRARESNVVDLDRERELGPACEDEHSRNPRDVQGVRRLRLRQSAPGPGDHPWQVDGRAVHIEHGRPDRRLDRVRFARRQLRHLLPPEQLAIEVARVVAQPDAYRVGADVPDIHNEVAELREVPVAHRRGQPHAGPSHTWARRDAERRAVACALDGDLRSVLRFRAFWETSLEVEEEAASACGPARDGELSAHSGNHGQSPGVGRT